MSVNTMPLESFWFKRRQVEVRLLISSWSLSLLHNQLHETDVSSDIRNCTVPQDIEFLRDCNCKPKRVQDAAVPDALREGMVVEQRHGLCAEHARGPHVRGVDIQGASGSHRCAGLSDVGHRRPYWFSVPHERSDDPRCQILAFEAQEPMYRLLRKNLEENGLLNIVEARNVAVGHVCHPRVGIANFVEDKGVRYPDCVYGGSELFNLGGIGLCGPSAREAAFVVPMVSVDSLELPRVDYMKIDVEGCEPLVILGAQETIKRCKPVIMFEFTEKRPLKSVLDHFGLQQEAVPESAEPLLRSLGYNSFTALPAYNWLAKVT